MKLERESKAKLRNEYPKYEFILRILIMIKPMVHMCFKSEIIISIVLRTKLEAP